MHLSDNYFLTKSNEVNKKCDDNVTYAGEPQATSAAGNEILGIFLVIFDKVDQKLKAEYISFIEISSAKSKIIMHALEKTLIKREIDFSITRFCCFGVTNLMPGKY